MIFVTVGKGIDPFDRLVEAVDRLAAELDEEVFVQYGCSAYKPVNAGGSDYITFPEAERRSKEATVIISHAGIGTIIGAIRGGTPIVVVPRRHRLKEHFNDHQMEVAQAVAGRPGVEVVYDTAGLRKAVERLRGLKGKLSPADTGAGLIAAIEDFIAGL